MSDARSLLRQQREARRITHPYANYSDAGKLLCTACREHVKTEALWDSHVRGEVHRKRIASLEQQDDTAAAAQTTSSKRKHRDDEDEDMEGGEVSGEGDDDGSARQHADRSRRKRSRPDLSDSDSFKEMSRTPPPLPPSMTRRSSGTPSQGVELQIPSRPATPRGTSSSSTNGGSAQGTALPSRQASTLIPGPPLKPATATATKPQTQQEADTAAPATAQAVDEAEWAAFEADMAATDYAADATISAPAMTSEEAAAAARAKAEAAEAEDGGDPRQRKTQREADLQGEKEDAQRALEEELDEMQNLEAKVARLKQQRDALKQRAASHGAHEGGKAQQRPALGLAEKENAAVVEEDEDEESDEEDDDGWDGFRFRTGVTSRS